MPLTLTMPLMTLTSMVPDGKVVGAVVADASVRPVNGPRINDDHTSHAEAGGRTRARVGPNGSCRSICRTGRSPHPLYSQRDRQGRSRDSA